ncbi:NAD-dependent epimerase/dehydratase family protein [Solwaraspora sp. WMMD406]|uniref:NAD-dependent epimerase/dehydratase family protein n=1 Tax=Solwaraspora sp. WMMD406 TaxID=3016095 RepID=UPI0024169068|nr:NAD-dependent epimerase/dehydratase family protein [Solwaraspora sp. WMMD406]MDG4764942.1 NAD-dependent epimerase/dehydratase family protein [Solwaraspora sp. WMMD406]
MRIVVTGAAGMLGTALLARPWPGVTWAGVDIRPPAPTVSDRAEFVDADVRDTSAMIAAFQDADVVIHSAAALPSHRPAQIRSVDVDGTASVVAAARRAGVGRLVHISSTAVYGLPRRCPTPEDYPREPVDAYSAAKLAAESIVLRSREQGQCAPILRPKTFLGRERLGLFAMLFEWADEGRHFPLLGGGHVATQMLDVDDLCDAIQQTCERRDDVVNDTFNIGAREFGTLHDDFQAVLDAAGHGKRVVTVPMAPAVATLRALAALRLSPVYSRLVHKLTSDSYVSVDKAVDQLGFDPRYSNKQALLKTYDWWRDNARTVRRRTGRTHRDPWRQGVLALAKALF